MYFVNNRFATCPISFSLYSTFNARPELERTESVSYTHLTLPTNSLV